MPYVQINAVYPSAVLFTLFGVKHGQSNIPRGEVKGLVFSLQYIPRGTETLIVLTEYMLRGVRIPFIALPGK